MHKGNIKWLLLLVIIMWGSNFAVTKSLLDIFPLWTLLFLRNFFAAITLLIIVRKHLHILPSNKKTWGFVLAASIIGAVINHFFLLLGIKYTLATNAALIMALTPLATAFMTYLAFQVALNWKQVLGICLGLFGVVLVILKGSIMTLIDLSFNYGDIFIFVALLTFSLSFIFIKKAADENFPPAIIAIYAFIISSLFYLPVAVWEQATGGWATLPTEILPWLMVLYIGIFPTGIGGMIWNRGISMIGPAACALFMNGVPIVAAITALLFLGEPILWLQITGFLFIATGILLGSQQKKLTEGSLPNG